MPRPGQIVLPLLYVILDAETLVRLGLHPVHTALNLVDAGVRLLQYRDKHGDRDAVLREARRLVEGLEGSGCRLILNDYVDLVGPSGFHGVHVGQGDVGALRAREIAGADRVLGVSTHNDAQLQVAAGGPADYVAIGPVFQTSTKRDAEAVVGVEGVRRARSLTSKPVVAIGGISMRNARKVLDAGADSVAVIGAVFQAGRDVRETVREMVEAISSQPSRREV